MLLIPRNNLYNKINKFLKGGPAYFKSYGINSDKFKSMFNALRTRGLSNQVAFEITWQSLKEVPNGYYSFGSRFDNVNSWADNVVNHQLKRLIYKNAVNATNFLEYRNSTLPYNKLPGYTRWLLEGRSQGKDFINQYIEENNLGEPVVMNDLPSEGDVITALKGVKLIPGKFYYDTRGNYYYRYNSDRTKTRVRVNDDGSFLWKLPNGKTVRTTKKYKISPSYRNLQTVQGYASNVVMTMENPTRKGYDSKADTWGKYTDTDRRGNTHTNIYAGIESHSNMGRGINYSKRYSTDFLHGLMMEDLTGKLNQIDLDLRSMDGGRYLTLADTMSLGNRMILLDIAHNVSPRSSNKNMPSAWPNLIKAMARGDGQAILREVDSGSSRRAAMRSDLIFRHDVTPTTVVNR